ncbi:hypothetical protein D0962_27995 [Leptolyngbyaceae cyanobacterium CCMR0082]|uniref:Polysaccharide biosynthesis protein n=1 Tax=Adonisia turfae CCMR0082 TaxID=2304604 RepID=A0A6M0SDJ6_9CYAN|nr:oligosaccharide flippase family protein [Adonisia turfae]MDV3350375.1 oligosaccharide flippase family protein [Leptothoe sp. LEGE 181152]NEZ66558.1 hypothetical protein [Adonisia turfae CCMR0082]
MVVAKANALVQGLVLATTPMLTRLYSPADFGVVALFSSSLNLLLAFSTWRFEWSIPNTKSKGQAASLIFLGFLVLSGISTTLLMLLMFFDSKLTLWEGFEALGAFIILLPFALIGGGFHQLMHAWYIRETQLTAVARSKVTQRLGATVINLAGGLANLGALGLISGAIASVWLGIGVLLQQAKGLKESLLNLSYKRIQISFLRFWQESTLSTGVAIANAASLTAVPVLLAQYYSATEIGWYALMNRLALTPVSLFTTAIGQSFWSEAAILVKQDRLSLRYLYLKSTKTLSLLAIPITIVCLLGPFFVGRLFGSEDWQPAGLVLAALAPMLLGQVIVSPLSHLVVHRKQHWQFIWDVCRLIMIISIATLFGRMGIKIESLVLTLSIINLGMYGLIFYLNLLCLNNENRPEAT